MTAPTHIVFTTAVMLLFGKSSQDLLLYSAIGAVLPDIDHNKSIIGRIFFFFSIPINRQFGHRGITHSLLLWGPIMLISFFIKLLFFKVLFWISFGAVTHIVLDSWNKSGVQMFKPITEKIFVMANKKYRIRVASREEFIVMVVLLIVLFVGYKVSAEGGVRKIMRSVISDYQTTLKFYEKQGTKICYFKGKIRFLNGYTEEGKWLAIGANSKENSIAVYDEKADKLILIPDEGEFLKCDLEIKNEEWRTLKVDNMLLKSGTVFYRSGDGKFWKCAKNNEIISGYILYRGEIELNYYKKPETYKEVFEKYEKEGVRVCRIKGELRKITGENVTGEWLIIGKNYGESSISIYEESTKKIYEIPQEAEFLSAELIPTGDFWKIENTDGVVEVEEGEFFFRAMRKFFKAKKGGVITGELHYIEGKPIKIKRSEI